MEAGQTGPKPPCKAQPQHPMKSRGPSRKTRLTGKLLGRVESFWVSKDTLKRVRWRTQAQEITSIRNPRIRICPFLSDPRRRACIILSSSTERQLTWKTRGQGITRTHLVSTRTGSLCIINIRARELWCSTLPTRRGSLIISNITQGPGTITPRTISIPPARIFFLKINLTGWEALGRTKEQPS